MGEFSLVQDEVGALPLIGFGAPGSPFVSPLIDDPSSVSGSLVWLTKSLGPQAPDRGKVAPER